MSESHPEHTQEMDSIVYLQGAAHFHTDDKKLFRCILQNEERSRILGSSERSRTKRLGCNIF